jgi:hypothetical protein
MSARENYQSALERVFDPAERSLWLGDKRGAPKAAQVVRDLQDLQGASERYQAIGWVTRGAVRAGLALLRPRLLDGGVLWLLLDEAQLLGAVSRALRLSSKSALLDEACEALVFSGFEQPRVLSALKPRLVLSASKPARSSALDVFFEQPPP